MKKTLFSLLLVALMPTLAQAETLTLYAAGSLKRALGDVAKAYEASSGDTVATAFGPSGLMRKRIEAGEKADVFASANMKHPKALEEQGKSGPVTLFARNKLCAIAQKEVEVTSETLLDVMLKSEIRLGTSTPKADPAGDYAFALFAKAEKLKQGAQKSLEAKAMQLTGGPNSEKAPKGRNKYGWVMGEKKADLFLTYCTNALLAKKEVPSLQTIAIPDALAVGADYGLTVLTGAGEKAQSFADFILSPKGKEILSSYGFETKRAAN